MPFPKDEVPKIAFWFSDYPERFLVDCFKNKPEKTWLYCKSEFIFKEWVYRLDTQHCEFSIEEAGRKGVTVSRSLPPVESDIRHVIVPDFPNDLTLIKGVSGRIWTIMTNKEDYQKHFKNLKKTKKKLTISPLQGLSKMQKYGYTERVLFSTLSLFPVGMEWEKLKKILQGHSYSLFFYPGFGKLRGTALVDFRKAVYRLLNDRKIYNEGGRLQIRKFEAQTHEEKKTVVTSLD